jgi:hypothetical protein
MGDTEIYFIGKSQCKKPDLSIDGIVQDVNEVTKDRDQLEHIDWFHTSKEYLS